jgi:hypothetical protein
MEALQPSFAVEKTSVKMGETNVDVYGIRVFRPSQVKSSIPKAIWRAYPPAIINRPLLESHDALEVASFSA